MIREIEKNLKGIQKELKHLEKLDKKRDKVMRKHGMTDEGVMMKKKKR